MAERQQAHRHELESSVVKKENYRATLGVFCGLAIGIAGIAGGCYVALQGQPTAGATIAGLSLSSLVGTFIYGTKTRREERERRQQASNQLIAGRK